MKSLQEERDFVAIGAEAVTFSPSKQQSAGLPDPDLNPSLNPTLARNLGRWAEVYFTTPPEQRDQAVQKLLRELLEAEQKRLGRWNPSTATKESLSASEVPEPSAQEIPQSTAAARPPLEEASALGIAQSIPAEEPVPIQASEVGAFTDPPPETSPFLEPTTVREDSEIWPEPRSGAIGDVISEGPTPPADSNPQSPAGVEEISRIVRPVTEYRPAVPRPGRRIAVTAAGALLCAGLFYTIGSRTGQEERGTRQVPGGGNEAENKPQPTATAPSGLPRPLPGKPFTKSAYPGVVQPAATRQSETLPALTAKQDGTQDVTTAEPYRTVDGVSLASTDTARSLWQEVAKQNVNALERLSAMYAKGEGVARDCDQARVLAAAAARKNPKGAASLLQELRAAGCE